MTEARKVIARFGVKFDTTALKRGDAALNSTIGLLKKFAGVAGLGFALRGINNFVQETTKAFDKIDKGSRTIGFSTAAFQEWQHTIQLAGASAEGLTKHVFFVQRAIGEAASGLATYSDAFTDLGLNIKDLQKLSPEKQFEAVFDSLAGVEDATKRAALAQRVMGRGGRELVVAMGDGIEAHRKNREELRKLGAIIGDNLIKKSATFVDRMTVLDKTMRAFRARALDKVIDGATWFVNKLIQVGGWLNKVADDSNILETALLLLQAALAVLAVYVLAVTWPILLAAAGIAVLVLMLEDLYTAATGGESVFGDFIETVTGSSFGEIIDFWGEAIYNFVDALKSLGDWWNQNAGGIFNSIGQIWDGLTDTDLGSKGGGARAHIPLTTKRGLGGAGGSQTVQQNFVMQSSGDSVRDDRRMAQQAKAAANALSGDRGL